MEEIFRFLQLRQTQKLSEEQKQLVGLPLYPNQSLSNFAKDLVEAVANEDQYRSVITLFRKKENNKIIINSIDEINPIILRMYNWLNFKAKPIKIDDFKSLILAFQPVEELDIQKEWEVIADNLIIAVYDKKISNNYFIDFQLLIKICYLIFLYLKIKGNKLIFIDNLRDDNINGILNLPVLIPARLLRSRCSGDCSEKGKVTLPGLDRKKAIATGRDKNPCECKCNENCQQPNFHCICINTYVSDLFIINEELARYEAGDIADIENILAGEKKVRHHRNMFRTEDTTETENETISSEERDHQVNEKFSLQSEVKNTIDTKVGVDAGVTATIKYGSVATITPHANVTVNYSKTQSENIARSYAKDITDRSVVKIQEKVRKLQTSKIISEIEEKNKHVIDNTKDGSDHRAGIYYWVNKVTHAQIFNHGKHLMFDLILPEPAAIFKKLYELKIKKDIEIAKPIKPIINLASINRNNYSNLLNQYGISGAVEPPNDHVAIQIGFHQNLTEPEDEVTTGFSSAEFKSEQIPDSYKAEKMDYSINCYIGDPAAQTGTDEASVSVSVGKNSLLNKVVKAGGLNSTNDWSKNATNVAMNGETGIITVAVAGYSSVAMSLSGTVSIHCKLTDEGLDKWRVKIYNLIMDNYIQKLDTYNQGITKDDDLIQIKGRNPFLNREVERNELKRHIIAILICNYFNDIGSMMEKVMPCGYPEIDFAKLEKDAPVIQFFEQVFEWNYITYLFYHSMWARKCKWPELIDEDSGDALFDKFLMAGACRVQIPVRPGMEEFAAWFLKTGQIWGASGIPPISGDDEYVSMIQELKESKQCDYTDRPGLIAATNGTDVLKLNYSTFYWDFVHSQVNSLTLDNDKDRELLLNYKFYRIVKVEQTSAGDNTAWSITIDRPYEDPTAQNLKHAVGALFVGAPWEIMIPTKLVYLRNQTDKLPVYPLS